MALTVHFGPATGVSISFTEGPAVHVFLLSMSHCYLQIQRRVTPMKPMKAMACQLCLPPMVSRSAFLAVYLGMLIRTLLFACRAAG